MSIVNFKITAVYDAVKTGSEITVGNILLGELISGKIYYKDKVDTEWIFYPGDTCEILS